MDKNLKSEKGSEVSDNAWEDNCEKLIQLKKDLNFFFKNASMKLPYAFVGMLLVAYKYKLTNNKNEYVVKTSLDLFSMSDEDNYQKINEKLTHNLTVAKLQESLIFMTFNIENVKGTFRYYLEQQLPAKVAKQLISKKNYEYKIYKNKVVIRRYITLTSFNDMKIQIEELRKECNRFYFMYA